MGGSRRTGTHLPLARSRKVLPKSGDVRLERVAQALQLDEEQMIAAVFQPRIATFIGRRFRWFPLLGRGGCLVCDVKTLTLYDRSDRILFTGDVTAIRVRKLRQDAFRLLVDGRSYVLYGLDPSIVRSRGKRTELLAYLDRYQTLDHVPGLSDEDDRNVKYHMARQIFGDTSGRGCCVVGVRPTCRLPTATATATAVAVVVVVDGRGRGCSR